MSKIKSLYLKYLQYNLPNMKKDELIEILTPLMIAALDENKESHREKMEESLRADMVRNPDRWDDKERAILQGEQEVPPALPVGESDNDMYASSSIDDVVAQLDLIDASEDILVEDICNAEEIAEQLRPLLFHTEMPSVGIMDDTLVLGWTKGTKAAILVFLEGEVSLQKPHITKEPNELMLDDEGGVTKDGLDQIIAAIHEVYYG
jgi:hypothetical protein